MTQAANLGALGTNAGTTGILASTGGGTGTTAGVTGFKNRIINGAMVIDQRNAGAAITVGGFPVDRFSTPFATDGAFSAQQDSSAPAGFTTSVKCTTTTADASLSASQYWLFRQRIEGYNVADLGFGTASAKTITLSFWVRSSLTGTFSGAILNGDTNRSYPFTYAISVANTWEQKSVTIAGDTSGTWNKTNGNGMVVAWSLGIGSTYQGTANAWGGAEYYGTAGSVSVIGTLSATWYVTGVQFEVGSTATSFDYLDYGRSLIQCQRYYFKQQATGGDAYFGSGFNTTTTRGEFLTSFPVSMRTAPTALEQSGTAGNYRVTIADTNVTCSAVPTFIGAELFSARTRFEVSSGLTAGQGSFGRSVNSSAYLAWSAEL